MDFFKSFSFRLAVLLVASTCWAASPAVAVTFDRNITIGMTFTLTAPTPLARVNQGIKHRDGVLYWYENMPKGYIAVGNEKIGVNLVIYDDNANATLVKERYWAMANDSSIDFMIGPVNSDYSVIAKAAAEAHGKLLIGTSAATSAFYLNGSWCYSAANSARFNPRNAFAIMRIKGAKTIGLIYDAFSPFAFDACRQQAQTLAEQGLQVVGMLPVGSTLAAISDAIKANISAAVAEMKGLNPDAVLGCIHAPALQIYSMQAMREVDWIPKMYTVIPDSGGIAEADNVTKNGLTVLGSYDATAKFSHSGINFNDSYSWGQSFIKRFNYEPDSFVALGTLAPLLLQNAIEKAGSTVGVAVRDAFKTLDVETFLGRVSYAADGANQNNMLLQQWQNGVRKIVAPPLFANAETVYPLPLWNERVFSQQFGSPAEIAVVVVTCIAVAVNIAIMVALLVYWKDPIIRASSPVFLSGILLGSCLLYASNFAALINVITPASCHLQAWFLALGFIIMFGSLFAKSWRVWRLYSNSSMDIIKISDLQVFLNIIVWISIMVVLLIALSAAGNLQPSYVSLDLYRLNKDYYTCAPTNPTAFTVVVSIIIAYCLLIILVGLFVAYKVRSIPFTVYDESKTIAFSMYNVSFFVILLVALRLSNAASREVLFLIQSFGIVICAVLTLVTMLYSKASYIIKGVHTTHTSNTTRGSASHRGSGNPSMTVHTSRSHGSSISDNEFDDYVKALEKLLKENNIPLPERKAAGKASSGSASKQSTSAKSKRTSRGNSKSASKEEASPATAMVQVDTPGANGKAKPAPTTVQSPRVSKQPEASSAETSSSESSSD